MVSVGVECMIVFGFILVVPYADEASGDGVTSVGSGSIGVVALRSFSRDSRGDAVGWSKEVNFVFFPLGGPDGIAIGWRRLLRDSEVVLTVVVCAFRLESVRISAEWLIFAMVLIIHGLRIVLAEENSGGVVLLAGRREVFRFMFASTCDAGISCRSVGFIACGESGVWQSKCPFSVEGRFC